MSLFIYNSAINFMTTSSGASASKPWTVDLKFLFVRLTTNKFDVFWFVVA